MKPKRRCKAVCRWEVGIDNVMDRSARCILPSKHKQRGHRGVDPGNNEEFVWVWERDRE